MPKGNPKSNYPNAKLSELDGQEIIGEYIDCLMTLADKGKPENEDELESRINSYFKFCADRNLRPGVESLSLCLGVSRVTFWSWCNAEKYTYSERWQSICRKARQTINAFLEMTALSGKLNPATSIFLLKNWCGYDDKTTLDVIGEREERHISSFDNINKYRTLPMFQDTENEDGENSEKG